MPTDYAEIYNRIIEGERTYNLAEHSPGLAACAEHRTRLQMCAGPSLDVGCGVGFAVEFMLRHMPWGEAFGCDVSPVAVERAGRRVGAERIRRVIDGKIPFDDHFFGLVTCFDVVEHLDEADLRTLRDELARVIRPGGWLCATVALKPAAAVDHEGKNAHRTVRPLPWWIELFDPDEATVYCRRGNAVMWRRFG